MTAGVIPVSEGHKTANAGPGLAGLPSIAPRSPADPDKRVVPHPARFLFSEDARRYAVRFNYQPTQAPGFMPMPRDEDGFCPAGRLLQWDRAFNGCSPLPYAVTGVSWTNEEREIFSDFCEAIDYGEAKPLGVVLGLEAA